MMYYQTVKKSNIRNVIAHLEREAEILRTKQGYAIQMTIDEIQTLNYEQQMKIVDNVEVLADYEE